MCAPQDTAEPTDNELLMLFALHRDEHAFRQLFERHAALVMSVCRQVAWDEQDAEDAFQATLLILGSRANRLLQVTSLGGWLHRVAYRAALRAARRRGRRREGPLADEPAMKEGDALEEIHSRELQQVLHEELQHLPLRYRNAIVLCDLEGNTRTQAAERLDCTEAAIKAALARGRRQLRLRVLRRGVVLTAALAMANQAVASVRAKLAPQLIDAALRSCVGHAPLSGGTAGCSASVQSLAQEGVAMTLFSVTRPLAVASIAAVLIAAPLILLGQVSPGSSGDARLLVAADSKESESKPLAASDLKIVAEAESPPQDATARNDRVKTLVDERIEVLRRLVALAAKQHSWGQVEMETLIRAEGALLDAELDAATTRTDRVRAYGQRLKSLQELEDAAGESYHAGAASERELLSVKAARLEVEIALLRARTRTSRAGGHLLLPVLLLAELLQRMRPWPCRTTLWAPATF